MDDIILTFGIGVSLFFVVRGAAAVLLVFKISAD